MIQPTKWSVPLGSGADVQELPNDDLKFASFSKIFPQITQVPLSAGGVAPRRIDFNSLFKLLADNIYFYQNGGVFEYSDTADYEKGAFVQYNNELYLCIQDNSVLNKHAPTDAEYWAKITTVQNSVITGALLPFASSDIPTGYLLCNGAEVSKDDYSELYSVIEDIYGTASSSDKFKLPDFRDRFIQGANGNLGLYIEAGLPNITGSLDTRQLSDGLSGGISNTSQLYQGAIRFGVRQSSNDSYTLTKYSDTSLMDKLSFNASYSNSIFGKSSTVQPPALAVNILIKY